MSDIDHPKIVSRLTEATEGGKVEWEPGTNELSFVAVFGDYSVAVSEIEGDYGRWSHSFRLRNQKGELVDAFDGFQVEALYQAARRSAFGAAKAYESILGALGETGDPPKKGF